MVVLSCEFFWGEEEGQEVFYGFGEVVLWKGGVKLGNEAVTSCNSAFVGEANQNAKLDHGAIFTYQLDDL